MRQQPPTEPHHPLHRRAPVLDPERRVAREQVEQQHRAVEAQGIDLPRRAFRPGRDRLVALAERVPLNSSLGAGFATDFAVVVGAPADGGAAQVEVSRGGAVVTTRSVAAGTSEAIELPMVPALQQAGGSLFSNASSATVPGGAYEVHSDVPVVAYQFNPLHFSTGLLDHSYTNDASLLIPEHSLTGSYKVQTWRTWEHSPFSQYRGFAAVAATEDGTTVTFTSSTQTADGVPGAVPPGGTITVTLDRGDVVQVLSGASASDDLTGTSISASAAVATFRGHDCTCMPLDQAACDHLEEMAFPVETWGALVPVTALQHPDGAGLATAQYRIQGRTGGIGLTFEPAVTRRSPWPTGTWSTSTATRTSSSPPRARSR